MESLSHRLLGKGTTRISRKRDAGFAGRVSDVMKVLHKKPGKKVTVKKR